MKPSRAPVLAFLRSWPLLLFADGFIQIQPEDRSSIEDLLQQELGKNLGAGFEIALRFAFRGHCLLVLFGMKDLVFQVSLGKPSRLYRWCQASIANYAKEVGADYRILTEPILRIAPDPRRSGRSREATEKYGGFLPIFEKANAYDLLRGSNGQGYDRIAIIDSDVWARPGIPNIFEELGEADFAGVRERDQPSNEKHLRKLPRFSRNMFGPLDDVSWDWDSRGRADFHNLGVMVIGNRFKDFMEGQSAREFLKRPEFQKFVNGEGFLRFSTEQSLMNWWMRKEGLRMKNLSWKWNALYSAIPNELTREAHLVHFFLRDKLPAKGENVEALEKHVS